MEHRAPGRERDGLFRLLSLELVFSDERCAAALSDENLLGAMARFEGALAIALSEAGLLPRAHADTIARVCEHASFDALKIAREAREAGTLAIPFVASLRAQVASQAAEAARFVHFGATSQDVMDTALALCLRPAAMRTDQLACRFGDALAALAQAHEDTPMLARTLLQPAAPVSFAWKVAMWLAPLARALPHYRAAANEATILQLGGAAGTLAAFGDRGMQVADALARQLGLARGATWHSARDGIARLAAETAILAGVAAKTAGDIALLMQAEVGELAEPSAPGRGGSSSMPHKRNPSGSMLALEAAHRVPGLAAIALNQLVNEHERGLGQWQSQWLTLRELVCAAASGLCAMAEVVAGLEVNVAAMRDNIDRTRGLVFSEAVSLRLSRKLADRLCEQAARERRHLLDVMQGDPEARRELQPDEMARLFDPRHSYGSARSMTEGVLARWASLRG